MLFRIMASNSSEFCHWMSVTNYGITRRIISDLADVKKAILTGQSTLDCTPHPTMFLVIVILCSIATQSLDDTISVAALSCAQGVERQLVSDLNACDPPFSDAVCRPQIINREG